MKKKRNRKLLDRGAYAGIATISLFGLLILALLFSYIIDKGSGLLSWSLITGDYYATTYDSYYDGELDPDGYPANRQFEDGVFYSEKWGIALKDDVDFEGKDYILVVYVSDDSPLANLPDKNDANNYVAISGGQSMAKIIFSNNTVMYSKNGAAAAIALFDNADGIKDMITTTAGSGIRGSLITTGYLIFFTMLIAMPLGIFTAIYLHEFAPKNKWYINVLRRSVELLTGVPSIIFGLLGAAVFIPLISTLTGASGGNLISGSLTLAVIVLPVIISSVELITSGIIHNQDEIADLASRILDESKRMNKLVLDMLDLSKYENYIPLKAPSTIDLQTVIREVMDKLAPQAKLRNIKLVDQSIPTTFNANQEHMEQLIRNLVENSIQYGKESGWVKVETKSTDKEITIKISDNGIGIPSADQGRVFERFYRVDKARSKKSGGTGLGLSIVKHIVLIYQGRIELESKEGGGTEIAIILPRTI